MKIWCDDCNKTEASVFCSADEAALCQDCDIRVHQANKLASKHQRLSLLQPSSSSSHLPQCDICQERKALLFCQQDRAVLCRDCDVSIHTTNELTKKHNRFILTGAKLSLLSSSTTTTKNMTKTDYLPQLNSKPQPTNKTIITHDVNNQSSSREGGGYSMEYSMEMLPEWQVEDLLNTSLDPVGFYKDSFDDELLFLNNGFRAPQAPNLLQPSLFNSGIFGVNENEGTKGEVSKRVSRIKMDDGFTVPQISPQSIVSKRSRSFW